jgi:hypothetical protein
MGIHEQHFKGSESARASRFLPTRSAPQMPHHARRFTQSGRRSRPCPTALQPSTRQTIFVTGKDRAGQSRHPCKLATRRGKGRGLTRTCGGAPPRPQAVTIRSLPRQVGPGEFGDDNHLSLISLSHFRGALHPGPARQMSNECTVTETQAPKRMSALSPSLKSSDDQTCASAEECDRRRCPGVDLVPHLVPVFEAHLNTRAHLEHLLLIPGSLGYVRSASSESHPIFDLNARRRIEACSTVELDIDIPTRSATDLLSRELDTEGETMIGGGHRFASVHPNSGHLGSDFPLEGVQHRLQLRHDIAGWPRPSHQTRKRPSHHGFDFLERRL